MPALTSVKDFTANTVLTAADMDNVNCGVKVFASAATRDAAYGGSGERTLEEGEMCYLNDLNQVQYYDGSAWQRVGEVGNAAASTASGSYTGTVHEGGTIFDLWTFNASGTLVVTTAGLADILLVGGGGGSHCGANTRPSGGGGGGGHLRVTNAYLPAGTLTVTIGAGGAAGDNTPGAVDIGTNGRASRLASYYSVGGGTSGGLAQGSLRGNNGGSGGGGCGASGGAGESGIGNSGGSGSSSASNYGSGGGGGAGGVGSNGTSSAGGNGGAGTATTITGSSVTRAGGGGGGSQGGTAGTGGAGGGGNGTNTSTPGAAGSINTGGGAGGTGYSASQTGGAAGGSGVVIIRAAR